MPTSCKWRGSGSCHGQCHPGEVTLFHSPNGSTKCLRPGMQAFCCETNTWADLIKTCEWRSPDLSCPPDKPYDLTYRDVYISDCPGDSEYKASTPLYSYPKVSDVERGGKVGCGVSWKKSLFCCGYNFQGCHWVGKGTCDDNECSE